MSFLKTTHQLKLKESKKQTRKSFKASAFDFIIDFRVRSEDFTTQVY